jgi:two-component system, LuxR family, response regulator FixJ
MDRHRVKSNAGPLIVVVDDDAAVRHSLKFSLEIDGFTVRTHASADELLRTGDLSGCRCLVIDQHMPRMTGLELVETLRRQGNDTAAILMSAQVTPTLSRLAAGAGVAVIDKPIQGNKLVEFIRAVLDGKSS